ncbi:hypothetical protein CRM22_007116 [Opisthorchis felineus]|uniref:carbonic anhydrase n=2 Tax=Opisthorchis felineus TaxID=147828 RepID=A0A4S2LHI7_OPIFE|nr:hypothetical protein CRM22_007116 [Opisthorchis felineus]
MAFDYGEEHGPHTWVLQFPDAGGKQQSPINLITSNMTEDPKLGPLTLLDNGISKQNVIMKAHNFEVATEGTGVLKGGPLKSEYKLVQFHFHWGSGNTWGSEHLVNGVSSPSEVHCVFFNERYGSISDAMKHPDGLTVLGSFLQLGKDGNPVFERLLNNLVGLKAGEKKSVNPVIKLSEFLPRNLSKYYTYPGSLTTPPCSECVTWIILDEPILISQNQGPQSVKSSWRYLGGTYGTDHFGFYEEKLDLP